MSNRSRLTRGLIEARNVGSAVKTSAPAEGKKCIVLRRMHPENQRAEDLRRFLSKKKT